MAMVLNKSKYRNSISLKMDLYNPGGFLNSTSFPYRHKKYEFELFEDDIIQSPLHHTINECTIKVKVSTAIEIDQLLHFLSNLKTTIVSKGQHNETA